MEIVDFQPPIQILLNAGGDERMRMLIFAAAVLAARTSLADSRHCTFAGAAGASFSILVEEGRPRPIGDADIGFEMACHVSQRWAVLGEAAIGMNTLPTIQVPVTVAAFYAVQKRWSVGFGAIGVLNLNQAPVFGGLLFGPGVQVRFSPGWEATLIAGPATHFHDPRESSHPLPWGASVFAHVAWALGGGDH